MAYQFYVVKSEDGRYYDYFTETFTNEINNHCIHHWGNAVHFKSYKESKELNAKIYEVNFVISKKEIKEGD